MSGPVRVVHYLNQFFAGVGGEERAGVGVSVREGAVGPGRALQPLLGEAAEIVGTVVCGDNAVSERPEETLRDITAELRRLGPDVVVAGPAFAAGRYGLACAQVCRAARALAIPALTAMHPDNPGALSFRREALIVPTGESATSMAAALQALAPLALRLGRRDALGPAEVEGYLPQGRRRVWDRGRPGWERALDMLRAKLDGRPFRTEVPYNAP